MHPAMSKGQPETEEYQFTAGVFFGIIIGVVILLVLIVVSSFTAGETFCEHQEYDGYYQEANDYGTKSYCYKRNPDNTVATRQIKEYGREWFWAEQSRCK